MRDFRGERTARRVTRHTHLELYLALLSRSYIYFFITIARPLYPSPHNNHALCFRSSCRFRALSSTLPSSSPVRPRHNTSSVPAS